MAERQDRELHKSRRSRGAMIALAMTRAGISIAPLTTVPYGILPSTMPEESTTPDLVELTRRQWEAVNRGDLDALMSLCPPDGVYDPSPAGLGVFEGPAAIRGFFEDWWGAFEERRYGLEEVRDLGNGMAFAVVRQDARPAGSTGHIRAREAYVYQWVDGLIARVTIYLDIDEARAAAERLAAERE
jgi:ketosteroid isomerase-like protein